VAGAGVDEAFFERSTTPVREALWRESPYHWMLKNDRQRMRQLAAGEGTNRSCLLANLAARGGKDYWTRIVHFGEPASLGSARGMATSWTTRMAIGFDSRDLALIAATLPVFALALHKIVRRLAGSNPGRATILTCSLMHPR